MSFRQRIRRSVRQGAIAAGLGLMLAAPTLARDFRVDTALYVDERSEPESRNVTVFCDANVYDFLFDPDNRAAAREATIFQPEEGVFTLLDVERSMQSRLGEEELLRLSAVIEDRARRVATPFLRFAAEPAFEETFDANSGMLLLRSKLLVYGAETEPPAAADSTQQYRDFADWSARLNATRTAIPSAARRELNAALASRRRLPVRIWRRSPAMATEVSTRHTFQWELKDEDHRYVRQAQDWARRFPTVDFAVFRRRQMGSAKANRAR